MLFCLHSKSLRQPNKNTFVEAFYESCEGILSWKDGLMKLSLVLRNLKEIPIFDENFDERAYVYSHVANIIKFYELINISNLSKLSSTWRRFFLKFANIKLLKSFLPNSHKVNFISNYQTTFDNSLEVRLMKNKIKVK